MALSASTNFTANRDEIVTSSLRIVNAVAAGETPSADEASDANQALNMMLKSWEADGLHLAARRRVSVLLEKNKSLYTLSTSGDYATYSENLNATTVKVNAAALATSIDVTTTTGMTAGDFVAFVMNDGNLHKTTIATVVDGDTITIVTGLSAASALGRRVWWFTNKCARPQRVLQAFTRSSADLDTLVTLVSQQEYWALSKKSNDGRVNQVYYDPQILAGHLYVWPETDTVTNKLELIVQKPFDDLDASTNNIELPTEWLNAIKFNLALMLSYEYGLSGSMHDRIERRAMMEKSMLLSYDQENTSIFFQPERFG